MEWHYKGMTIVDDKTVVDVDVVHALLQQSYWANERPKEMIARSLEHSLCFSVLKDGGQIGFARVVTDYAVFSWIADVIIDPRFRGQGIGKFLMQCVTEHPAIKHTMQTLCTKDAHGLYERYGFMRNEFMRKRPEKP
jgi:GNAT superfamily N-acetyltransferase